MNEQPQVPVPAEGGEAVNAAPAQTPLGMPPPPGPRPQLTPEEARVLGCLIEKHYSTPEYYPLTLNALTAACNQKNNRDPIMNMTEHDVMRALDGLRYEKHLAMQVSLSGSRAPKYRHETDRVFNFGPAHLSVLCELLIRGPQTPGELRTRAGRLHEFTGAEDLAKILEDLAQWGGGSLVVRLPREPGQREARYAHLLCGDIPVSPESPAPRDSADNARDLDGTRLAKLEAEVADLRGRLASLESQLGADSASSNPGEAKA